MSGKLADEEPVVTLLVSVISTLDPALNVIVCGDVPVLNDFIPPTIVPDG